MNFEQKQEDRQKLSAPVSYKAVIFIHFLLARHMTTGKRGRCSLTRGFSLWTTLTYCCFLSDSCVVSREDSCDHFKMYILTIKIDTLISSALTSCFSSDTLIVVRFISSSGVLTGITGCQQLIEEL